MNAETLYVILAAFSISGLLLLLPFALRRRHFPAVDAFIVMILLVIIWLAGFCLEINQLGVASARLWGKAKYIGAVLLPMAWLVFALRYTGSKPELRRRHLGLLFVVPLIVMVTIALDTFGGTRPDFRLLDSSRLDLMPAWMTGIYLIHAAYAYFMTLAGCYILLRTTLYSPVYHRSQILVVGLAILLPIAANVISNVGYSPFDGLDMTPLAFAWSVLIMARMVLTGGGSEVQVFTPDVLLSKLPDGMMVLNQQNQVVMVNPPLASFLNRSVGEMMGQPVQAFFPAEWLADFEQDDTGRIHDSFFLHDRYLEISRAPLRDRQGRLQGRLISVRDNTLRKQTEIALRVNERRYRALFENSHDAIFIVDPNWTILIANPQAAQLMHLELDTLIGSNAQRYMKPEQTEANETRQKQLFSGATLPVYELAFVRPDGAEVLTEVNLTLVRDAEGMPRHLQMVVRDITLRKQNERLLNQRVEQFAMLRQVEAEINSSLDIEEVVRIGLAAAMSLSGADAGFIALTRDEEVKITAVSGAFPETIIGDSIRYDTGIVGRVLLNQEPELVLDVSVDPDYKEDIPTTRALVAFPLISHEQLLGLINLETANPACFAHEIVEFIQLITGRLAVAIDNARLYGYVTQQLDETRALNRRLDWLQQTQRDMIRIANHDLKNPLAVILGYLEIFNMDKEKLDPIHQEAVDLMHRSANRMNQIIEDILTLERIEQRAAGGTYTRVNLLALVQQAVKEYQPQAQAKSQTLRLESPTLVPEPVIGDATELYEAMVNFISNAIKYTPPEGSITIRLEDNGEMLRFEVQDTGFGIPKEQQESLFQPFYRAKTEDTQAIEGTGLGLHLVKNIVERHGGSVHFHSVYGEGSTFGFQLPRRITS